jgi:hypothetical protein
VDRPPTDRRSAEERLGSSDRHLIEAADRLRRARARVLSRLPPGSRSRRLVEELLTEMERSVALMREHRALILREMGEDDPAEWADWS